jgi:acetyl esterase
LPNLPFLYESGADAARKVPDDIPATSIAKPDMDEKWTTVAAEVGDVRVRIVKLVGSADLLPAILNLHGGSWILDDAGTHDRLVRELAVGVNVDGS